MNRLVDRAIASLLCVFPVVGISQNGPVTAVPHLEFAEGVRLVSCDPASEVPCFRMRLNVVDEKGAPAGVVLPPIDTLARSLTVNAAGEEITPFYASAPSGPSGKHLRRRIALVLIDVSGSMNLRISLGRTRFSAARAAAETFVNGFQDRVDSVAVVPFASRNVVSTIRNAQFAGTAEDLHRQVQALPIPESRNNTALYSAVDAGIDTLKEAARNAGNDPQLLLLVMTDGKNDVQRGDDAGLLDGAQGLALAARKVKESGIQAIGVGFGDRGSIDEIAMRQITTQTYIVDNADDLVRVFSIARELLNDRIEATFTSPWRDRASLAGQSIAITASLRLPDGRVLPSKVATWTAPNIGVPAYEAKCSAEESQAVLRTAEAAENNGWFAIIRTALVFLGYAILFFLLWFWAPRLIWPDRYLGDLKSIHYRRKWAAVPGTKERARKTQAPLERSAPPPGFGAGSGAFPLRDRAPTEETYVQPRVPSESRSRLDLEWTDHR